MKKTIILLIIALITTGFYFLDTGELFAQVSYAKKDCSDFQGLTERLVSCIEDSLSNVSDTYLNGIRSSISQIIGAALQIYLLFFILPVIFGGVRNLRGDTAVAILTITLVSYMTYSTEIDDYIFMFSIIQEEFINIVTQPLGEVGVCGFADRTVWQSVDCTIANIFGAYIVSSGQSAITAGGLLTTSDVGFIGITIVVGYLFTPLGPLLLVAFLAIPILMTAAFIQGIIIYITSLIAVIFLGLIAPMVIPMLLFKSTKEIFTRWFNMLIAYTLQPGIVFAYLTFMMSVLNYLFDMGGASNTVYTGPTLKTIYEIERTTKIDNGLAKTGQKYLWNAKGDTTSDGKKENKGAESKNTGKGTAALIIPEYRFFKDKAADKALARTFLELMIIMVIALYMTFSFLVVVINSGAQLAGLNSGPMRQALNVFNAASGGIAAAAKAARGGK